MNHGSLQFSAYIKATHADSSAKLKQAVTISRVLNHFYYSAFTFFWLSPLTLYRATKQAKLNKIMVNVSAYINLTIAYNGTQKNVTFFAVAKTAPLFCVR
jgi:hypothetical protein